MHELERNIWANALDSDERWDRLNKLGSGGQGVAFIAVRRDTIGPKQFLKILKDKTNPERRARMFREAAALATYSHPRIPKLIETNAHLFAKHDADLYLVTELVQGKDLSFWKKKTFPIDDALLMLDQLADVVAYCDGLGGIHRDIKPDNIILRNGNIDAVLVDFGLTFNRIERDNLETGDWQELGNRFLRLPELSSYSTHRHDIRSDIAFLAGILYFCLFGRPPADLTDALGRLPHQREGISLHEISPNASTARLLARFFDVAFQPRPVDRFKDISDLKKMVKEIHNSLSFKEDANDPAEIAEQIKKGFSSERTARQQRQAVAYRNAQDWVYSILSEVSALLDGVYIPVQSGEYDPATDARFKNCGLKHHFRSHLMRYLVKTTFRFIGSELIITIADFDTGDNEIEVLRTDSEFPNFSVGNRDIFKTRLLKGIAIIPQV